jgi:hypothetical protein
MNSTSESGNSEQIADVMSQWLSEEIINSDGGRNSILSDYEDRRNDLFKSFDDQSNFQAQKAIGHYNRFIQWVTPYKENGLKSDDWFTARLSFACLISASGSYRKQCFFESADESDYLRRRYGQPAGLDIHSVVEDELSPAKLQTINSMDESERIDYIVERSLRINDENLDLHSLIHDWAISHKKTAGSLASAEDVPVLAMKEAQRLWIGLAAAHVVIAASFRDSDYSRVPFLEPKSITDVTEIIYPLAS